MTCPLCHMPDGEHADYCITQQEYGDAPVAMLRLSQNNHDRETAVWRERVHKLEAVVEHLAIKNADLESSLEDAEMEAKEAWQEVEALRGTLANIVSLANDGLAADPGAVHGVLYRIRDAAGSRPS